MAPYEAFDEDVDVHGRTILRVVDDALARFADAYRETARDALAANGIDDPSPDEWYPQQAWLNTFEVIAAELEPHILDRLGEQIPDVAEWPADPDSVPEGLRAIDDAYRRNHRGGDIGFYRFAAVGDREAEMTCRTPYPCPFDRGLIRAVARKHAPVEAFVFVEERGDRCRRDGDDACVYTVSW
ncbi:hypothetical protein ACOZ4L_03970 [Haloplanus ruber]|uniref:4-vinyl reductase 4VR domain-containing protein n=1 Tax=Haloplanus ruber TaxID=869892 RepID=A0ABD6D0C8_9EURY|nr:hypothetical protein [Haloplanus ruber]